MGKDRNIQRLRQSRDDLYDVWEDVKGRLDDANETFEAYKAAVQMRFDAALKDSMAARNGMGTMLQRIERRRLNIDAVLRGRKRPFPDEKGTSADLLRDAREMIASFERAASPDVAELYDGVDEEIAEKELEGGGAVSEEDPDAALASELGDEADSEEGEEAA